MGLVVRMLPGETCRETVIRYAKPQGLTEECLQLFDEIVKRGDTDPLQAVFVALMEWDCVPYEPA